MFEAGKAGPGRWWPAKWSKKKNIAVIYLYFLNLWQFEMASSRLLLPGWRQIAVQTDKYFLKKVIAIVCRFDTVRTPFARKDERTALFADR